MVEKGKRKAPDALNQEVKDIWNQNADFWDEMMGNEGNDFHKYLIEPTQERLLNLQLEELVLDVACGNGQFSRRMAQAGARVVAFDFSQGLIERAKARTIQDAGRIQYMVMDATDTDRLMDLGKQRFDAAVCTMALMDIAVIEPLIWSLARLLRADGRFVFSVLHPCFNSLGSRRLLEEEDRDGELTMMHSVRVSEYSRQTARKTLAAIGQPAPAYVFHRPISTIFNACFSVGFVLDGLEEPVFAETREGQRPLDWANYKQIPPVLVTRMRLVLSREER